MSDLGQHAEWLSLIEVSGPFLAEPVLKEAFPQGLEGLDNAKKKLVRQAYDEWREAIDLDDPDALKLHQAWIELVLRQGLELDEDGLGDVLKHGADLPDVKCELPEHGIALTPDFAVVDGQSSSPLMLIVVYEPQIVLDEAFRQGTWSASPGERMVELCRATGVRLGLVTNGEQWMLVDAPVGAVTTFASWYGRLWSQEPITLQAFVSLLGIRRFFVDRSEQLPALFDNSLKYQDDVTDALGEQVRRAVEVLIQALDRAHVDSNRTLLEGVEPTELYEAGLTVMMRIVFLLSAEERGLLLLGDELYEANYAVSTLRLQLRSESEEILERRWDAWSRLLSLFRAVFGGIDHEALRLPALGGSLFDPDRFPFLEGRPRGSRWKVDMARPLPIDNRTVLLLLEAVQLFRGRTLSYMALDVEQIGYVYEGLLERTVVRAAEVTLDLDATKDAKSPWIALPEIEDAAAGGRDAVEVLFKDRMESSASRIRNDLNKPLDDVASEKLLTACHANRSLRDRIAPYFHLLRTDPWGYPLVYPTGTFMVASGSDRRETGTHYTPKSFTEAIVKETLEPLVYVGPSDGKPRDQWQLKPVSDILDLKVCDPAMGSGAFLVQVCRFLSERLSEAWTGAESSGKSVTSEGTVVDELGSHEPLRVDSEERLITARRLIAERCLYGVDMNPLAVELAKLSIWLVTLAKGRPFGFLDHNLRSGDSLLGITDLDQLHFLDFAPSELSSKRLFASKIDEAVTDALELRAEIRRHPIRDIRDVEVMAFLDHEARTKLALPGLAADALVGEVLAAGGRIVNGADLSVTVGAALDTGETTSLVNRALRTLNKDLPAKAKHRRAFHWPLEYPEVFSREHGGFDAIVGNPPFAGGQLLSGHFGTAYQNYLVNCVSYREKSSVDLVVFFFLQAYRLIRTNGCMGLIARRSISEGKNRDAGLTQLLERGATIIRANTNLVWPGKASVIVHQIHITKSSWQGPIVLNAVTTEAIFPDLSDIEFVEAHKLPSNSGRMFQGSILLGEGFKIDEATARRWIAEDSQNADVLYPFIGGNEINQSANAEPQCWVINFWDWSRDRAEKFVLPFEVVRSKVKPNRDGNKRPARRDKWWIYGETATGLYRAIGRGDNFAERKGRKSSARALERVLVISTGVSKYPAFTFLAPNLIYSNKLCVLADQTYAMFAALSSDIHGIWAWAQKTSLGADLYSLVYAHGNIFETFPFPDGFLEDGSSALEELGKEFFDMRQSYMEQQNGGLTKFYNDFHDCLKVSAELTKLRSHLSRLNRIMFDLYGWGELDSECDYYEVDYLPVGSNIRFTLNGKTQSEVRRRLSKLNRLRYLAGHPVVTNGAASDYDGAAGPDDENDLFKAQNPKRPIRQGT
ncbi:BREX-1 system adenine-specific DNA-methyltransferase PglX [Neorhizobium galegae]|uniref:BREX-1 system adenine-specific DNA-methyltransferase PglX n=1 Tax=Neorhizobium galegae TaxID=399 RepID=UPI000622289D|nr:BREX-1 system adenine-specific DNA-methyltransferase PglX [Neorhizobium galegae]MCQ1805096.1 BREX-1 system adenine-specific DNA-methyltransferase PglX [Neorhizobium galegae]CDZ55858.1 Hypothetical protein NGAL_HAMBI2566_04010 [Neorhizobium galegae bv. orientalis]